MRPIITLFAITSVFLAQLLPVCGQNQEKAAAPKSNTAAPKNTAATKARPLPFRGTVKAVDRAAGTFTIGQRTFRVSKQTKITSDGKPVELKDELVGQWVTGSYRTSPEGKLEAGTVYVGGKSAADAKTPKKSRSGAATAND